MINRKEIADQCCKNVDSLVIGFTASTADLIHPGFLAVLEEGKRMSDYFVVGLQTNPQNDRPDTKQKPFQTAFERWAALYSCRFVDLVIPFDTEADLLHLLQIVKPDIRLVGEEYKGTAHTGYNLPMQIHYNERLHDYSSTAMRNRVLTNLGINGAIYEPK